MAQPITSVSVTTKRGGAGQNKPQRHNNPGNIKYSPLIDQWVQKGPDGVTPLADEQGHLIFATIEDGWAALEADIAAKQDSTRSWLPEGASLETLGKGVGWELEGGGQGGYAEDPLWASNVAQILGLPIDTPINQIPLGDLTKAIARQEGFYAGGGGEFETTAGPTPETTSSGLEGYGRAVDRRQQLDTGIEAVMPADMGGATGEERTTIEEALGKQDLKDKYGGTSVPLDYGKWQIETDPYTDITTRGHLFPRGPETLTPEEAFGRVERGEPLDTFSQEEPFNQRLAEKQLTRTGYPGSDLIDRPAKKTFLEKLGGTTKLTREEAIRRGQAVDSFVGQQDQLPTTASAGDRESMISRYENAAGSASNPYSSDRAAKTAAPKQPSFLSRLGSGIKDNPETAASIAALVGGVGSGLMSRGRLAKQQSEQDAANRQAAAYSNAISTLTRGRTTPVMAPEQVRSAPGTAETIFDVLGTLGSGAGQIAGDKRLRDQATEDREFSRDIQTRGLDIKEYEIEQRTLGAAAKAAANKITTQATSGVSPEEAQVIRAGLKNLQAIFDSGGPFETGTLSFDRTYGESAAIQNDFDASRNTLIRQIKELMGLGRLTDRDLQLVIDTLPQRNDSAGAIRGTLRGIEGTLSRLESIYGGGGGGMGQTTGNQFSNMTANELADYLEANPNDAAALADAATR
jgi:hypothetical protein